MLRTKSLCDGLPGHVRVSSLRVSMKYPKLAAAIDEFLAKQVRENGEDLITFAIASLTKGSEIVSEKAVAIPVTKELVLSEQTEVRNGD